MTLAITVREAKAALVQMKKLTPARPRLDDDAKLSLKETVFFMAPELAAMTKRGFTLKELADGLQAQNIPVKPATLNRYLNEYKAGQAEGETGAAPPRKEPQNPPADSAPESLQEPAESDKTGETETKAEVASQSEDRPSEPAGEKSETIPPAFRRLLQKGKDQNPLGPPQESPSQFRM